MWEFRMKSFSALIKVLYPPLIGPPLTLTSLLTFTSVTKSPGIFENVFMLRLAQRPNVSESEKAGGFVIDKFNSAWCWVKN